MVTWGQLSQLCPLLTSCPTLSEDVAIQAYFCLVLLQSGWLLLVLLCLVEAVHAGQKQVLLEVSAVLCCSQDIQGFHLAILPDQFHYFLASTKFHNKSIKTCNSLVTTGDALSFLLLERLDCVANLFLAGEGLELCWKLVPSVYIASMGWHIHPFSYQQRLPSCT